MIVEFIKDKETKSKIRYTAKGEVSGSIYVDKESELAKDAEIVAFESFRGEFQSTRPVVRL